MNQTEQPNLTPPGPRKTLVLGELATARIIAKQLKDQNLDPVFPSSLGQREAPWMRTPEAISQMRVLLSEFANFSQKEGLIHPGTSIWAERPELPTLGEEVGLAVISPSSRVLSFFRNQLVFLISAEQLGIPTLVQIHDPIHTWKELERYIQKKKLRLPLALKSTQRTGSSDILVAQDLETLRKSFPTWLEQLQLHHPEGLFFIERYAESARILTLPFARLKNGRVQVFPLMDSSLQFHHRKWIEFCPPQHIDTEIQNKLIRLARLLIENCGFVGVGALEFVVEGNKVFLRGGIPRLNTSFPLWEEVANTSAVAWQLAAFEENTLESMLNFKNKSHSRSGLSVRIYAENSLLDLPQPGEIFQIKTNQTWSFPQADATLFLNYKEGDTVPVDSSGLLTILFVHTRSHKQSLLLAEGILNDFWIAGSIQTNEKLLIELLSHSWIKEGIFHKDFIDEDFLPSTYPPAELLESCIHLCKFILDYKNQPTENLRWSLGEKWIKDNLFNKSSFQWIEKPLYEKKNQGYALSGVISLEDHHSIRVYALSVGDRWMVRMGPWFFNVRSRYLSDSQSKDSIHRVYALSPGRIHSILFQKGAIVPAHESLVMIESLGRLVPHALPISTRILQWKVKPEDPIQWSQELAEIEYLR